MAKVLSGHRDHQCFWRCVVEFASQIENLGGRVDVRELPRSMLIDFPAGHFAHANFRGTALSKIGVESGIYEKDELTLADRISEFRGELMQTKDFDLFRGKLPFQSLRRAPSHAVVAPKGIAVGKIRTRAAMKAV